MREKQLTGYLGESSEHGDFAESRYRGDMQEKRSCDASRFCAQFREERAREFTIKGVCMGASKTTSADVAEKLVRVFLGEISELKAKRRWNSADLKNFKRMREAIRIVQACRE